MSGVYEYKRLERGADEPPVVVPAGALGDIGSALFGVVGALAALRHRDLAGVGQHVDVAMYDAMVAMTDLVTNFHSMGLVQEPGRKPTLIMDGFRARDGWFIIQVGREHQFERLATMIGCPEWVTDPRFASRQGWVDHLDDVIRPAIETWAASRTKLEACDAFAAAGHRRRAVQLRGGRHRRPARRGAPHAGRDGTRRWRRRAGADPRQPDQDVRGRGRPGDRASPGWGSTPTRCCGPSSASTTPPSPRCATTASSPDAAS